MNELKTTTLVKVGTAAAVFLGTAALLVPFAGEILAGTAVAAALFAMGTLELKKRAY